MSKCTPKRLKAQTVEKAMEQHAGLVHAFIQHQGGDDIPYEEALQAGRIGLWYVLKGYDPGRGTAFSTYAWVAIHRHIHRRAKELSRAAAVGGQERPRRALCPILRRSWWRNSPKRPCTICRSAPRRSSPGDH